MKLTILGCLGAYPYQNQGTTSFLLESEGFHLLIDAGSATLVELEKRLDPLALDAVILSHYHHDHIADLGVLQYYWQLYPKTESRRILPIYGHVEDLVHFEALTLPEVTKGFNYLEDEMLKIGPFQISFLKTIHPVPCYAMRIVEKKTGKVLVYTGDSGYLEDFISFSADANLFLADTYLFSGNENHHAHFTAKETGEIARKANVKEVVLTHLPQHGDLEQLKDETIQAAGGIPVHLAAIGKTFEI